MLGQTTVTAPSRQSRFYLAMAIAAAAVVFIGFAPTYYLRALIRVERYPSGTVVSPSLPALLHVHALVATAWLCLLLAQAALIASRRTDLHRRLGLLGAFLAIALVVLGVMTAMRGAKEGWNPGGPFPDSLGFLAVTLGDLLLFSGFVATAFWYRRQQEAHKRLMLFGTLAGLMWPAITRMPFVAPVPARMFAVLVVLIAAVPIRDYLVDRRVRPISAWSAIIILASFPLRIVIGNSDPWHRFAAWLIRT